MLTLYISTNSYSIRKWNKIFKIFIFSLNNTNKPIPVNINDYRLMPLSWFLKRCWLFYPPLLLSHQCKCQPNEKGKSHLPAMKIIVTSWMPTLVTADHIWESLAWKYMQIDNFIIMTLSQNHNFGTDKNKHKEFLKGLNCLLCGSTKTFFLIKLNSLRKGIPIKINKQKTK